MSNEPFADPSDLREWMQEDATTLPEATAILALRSVSAAVRQYCQWHISEETVDSLKVRSRGVRSLWLPTLHLREVTSLAQGAVVLSLADYEWFEEGRIELLRRWWTDATFTVSFQHGYLDTDAAYDSVRGVVLAAAARAADNPASHRSETSGGEATVAAGAGEDVVALLSAGEKKQLQPLQLPMLG